MPDTGRKKENQILEWKESWRDEYLKWICGFANADGGTLVIGRDDQGKAVGVKDAKNLLEDLPNKIRDVLGLMVDVRLHTEKKRELIEIHVDAYPYPINYKGQYYYRSGSTKQELKGAALDRFLLEKQGKTWDGVPVPGVSVSDLDAGSIAGFRDRALRSRRIANSFRDDDDDYQLLEKLHLTDHQYLKRASILLFHPEPQRFVTGASIKIGYFRNDSDLVFQDEIQGNLFFQVDQVMTLLLTKYLKAGISYQGLQREESYPVPEEALREALLNAVTHKDYSGGTPVQIDGAKVG
jgi:ATP-dependent DNA helicase RecG